MAAGESTSRLAGDGIGRTQTEIDALKSLRLTATISINSRFEERSYLRVAKEIPTASAFLGVAEIVALKLVRQFFRDGYFSPIASLIVSPLSAKTRARSPGSSRLRKRRDENEYTAGLHRRASVLRRKHRPDGAL
jgi:hypothetical protein